jgi:hypothetical protein
MAERINGRYKVGMVGVDAGMVMVGDPCYLNTYGKESTDGFEWVESEVDAQKSTKKFDYSYSGACAATLGEDSAGELGRAAAVAVSSGYGDGVYPVYATYNHEGRISKLEVVFVAEDDEDFENDDEDETECVECGETTKELNGDEKCAQCAEDEEDEDEDEA